MTTDRDFDRIARAWLDLMPDEAPDRVVSIVLQAAETTPQLQRPLGLARWRLPYMNRLTLGLAAAAVVIAVVAAGALLFRPASNVGGPPVSPSTDATPLVPGLGRGMGYSSSAPAVLLDGPWVTDADLVQGLFHDARIQLEALAEGGVIAVTYQAETAPMLSQPVTGLPESLSVVSMTAGSGCSVGDYGVYQLVPGADDATETFVLVSDTCGSRASLLARTWTRALDGASKGGRGVITVFDPLLLITLPPADYTTNGGTDAVNVTSASPDRTLIAVKNPAGFADPCTTSGGAPVQQPHTIAGFSAYLDTLPGLTVESETLVIDGYPAAHLIIPTSETADCPSHRVMEWTPGDAPSDGGWFITQGDTDVVYMVQVDGDLYLLQWLGMGVTPSEELSVLSTAHFITTLPSGG